MTELMSRERTNMGYIHIKYLVTHVRVQDAHVC